MNKSTFVLALTLVSTSFLYSCNKGSTAEDLKDAQMCLNTASPAQAESCVAKIASDGSPEAYKLRCAAVFIAEGFGNPSSFISALDQLNNNGGCGGTCSSTIGAVTALKFSTSADPNTNKATAAKAFDYCSRSNIGIYSQISTIFNLGTIAASVVGSATPSETDIKNALIGLPPQDLGQIAISAYSTSCSNVENASDSTKKFCKELEAAVNFGTGSPADVGDCFQQKIQHNDPNYTCT